MEPEAALRTLVGFTFDYQLDSPDFIRLVMNENMHRGEFIRRSATIQELKMPAINAVQAVYERGAASGVFADMDPIDLHMSISALCFFNVANRHTFSAIFKLARRARGPGPAARFHHRHGGVLRAAPHRFFRSCLVVALQAAGWCICEFCACHSPRVGPIIKTNQFS